jgi:hypothetical protein
MNLIPFGEVEKERYSISKRYGLIEKVGGIWRLTAKCKNAYDSTSYVYYLQGKVEKPSRIDKQEVKQITKKTVKQIPQQEMRSNEFQSLIDDILKL